MNNHTLLSGIVGSTAYGLQTESSDVDYLGVFAAPTAVILGLEPVKESRVTKDPDSTLHEAHKYVRLALAGNPTVSELLWLDDYEYKHRLGSELIEIRSFLLSRKRVRDAHLGYASDQFNKLMARGGKSFSADTRHRTAKHARHMLRLLVQGYELYSTGQLTIKVEDPLQFFAFGDAVANGAVVLAQHTMKHFVEKFDQALTPLPEQPDKELANDWLLRVRKEFWDR